MFFGIGPFGFGINMGNQGNHPNQQQNGFVHNQNMFGLQQPQQQQNGNGGFFNQFANFMNPFFQTNQNRRQPPRQEEQPRPSFFRRDKNNKKDERLNSTPKTDPINSNTGVFWKNKGNEAYQKGNYLEAIDMYSKAMQFNNTESIFFSNRAQAYKKLGKLEEALKDAQQAIELDSNNARGHILAGQCLAQFGKREDNPKKIQSAITRLTKALTLSSTKKIEIQKEASRYIYLAKKVLFYIEFNQLRNARLQAIKDYNQYLDKDTTLTAEVKEKKMQDFINASDQKILFTIPDYLICKITFEIMEDPVVTDSGQTYERSAIEEHIEHNGRTDPFTRQPIKGPLYSCMGIKKAVEQFLQRNPWAYEYSEGQNYKDIQF